MKLSIAISILVFSTIGGFIGQLLDNGNWLGGWGIIFSTLGSFFGIWAGYKFYQRFL